MQRDRGRELSGQVSQFFQRLKKSSIHKPARKGSSLMIGGRKLGITIG